MTKIQVQVVAGIVVVVFTVGIFLSGGKVQLQWLKFYSAAVFIAVVLLGLWDRFVWHLPLAQRIKGVPRDIRGTWKGTFESNYVPPGSATPVAKPAYLVVRQRASEASATLITDESKSRSTLAIVTRVDGEESLDYMYINQPRVSVENRSRMHHGSASLAITGRPPIRLRGRYWTDRETQGELSFDRLSRQLAEDLEQAHSLFQ